MALLNTFTDCQTRYLKKTRLRFHGKTRVCDLKKSDLDFYEFALRLIR